MNEYSVARIEAIIGRKVKRDIGQMTEWAKGNLARAAEAIMRAGYRCARPTPPFTHIRLAPHGRSIQTCPGAEITRGSPVG